MPRNSSDRLEEISNSWQGLPVGESWLFDAVLGACRETSWVKCHAHGVAAPVTCRSPTLPAACASYVTAQGESIKVIVHGPHPIVPESGGR